MPDFITAKAAKTVWHTDLGLYLAAPQYIFLAHATQHPFEMKKKVIDSRSSFESRILCGYIVKFL